MADPITLPPDAVDEAVFAAVAIAERDAEANVLAGISAQIAGDDGGPSAAELSQAIAAVHDAIIATRPDPGPPPSPDVAREMRRVLARLVPALDGSPARAGARTYTREFLVSHRRGAGQLRQVAPIDLQFDRFSQIDRFIDDTWSRLHQLARSRPAVAQAVDGSALSGAIGVMTSEDAGTILARVPIEPLNRFVGDRLQPDGSMLVPPEDVDATLLELSAKSQELASAFAANLVAIDGIEQAVRDVVDAIFGDEDEDEPKSELAKAIEKAEKEQKRLDEILGGAAKATKATLGIVALIAAEMGDDELAGDIKDYADIVVKLITAMREAGSAAIATAKFVDGVLSASATELAVMGTAAFSVALLAAMLLTTGVFANRTKPVNQVILEALRAISEQIADLRDEMRVRFDRIERRLNEMYAGIVERLAEIDFDLGEIAGNIDDLQLSLYRLHARLQRLNRDVHAFLDAEGRRPLVEAINGFLNFEELTGQPLDFDGFREAENIFFSWGHDHAKDPLQAGPEERGFGDLDLVPELTSAPLATNINYLSQVPAERYDLPPLSPARLANPFDWIVAGETYAQLSEESPDLADQMSPTRVADLVAVGEALSAALSDAGDPALLNAVAEDYRSAFDRLVLAIEAFHAGFIRDDETGLSGIDMWDGPEQDPSENFFRDDFTDLGRCGGGAFGGGHDVLRVPPEDDVPLDHGDLLPYVVATNLSHADAQRFPGVASGLRRLTACVAATWSLESSEPTGLGNRVRLTFQLFITINIRYGDATVFTHRFKPPRKHITLVPADKVDTFDPAKEVNPHAVLVPNNDDSQGLWARLKDFPVTHQLVNPALLSATANLVQEKLVLLQRAFYREVAQRSLEVEDDIQTTAAGVSGIKLLWQALVAVGFPSSIEANDILRSLLFGSDAVLGGTAAAGDEPALDNVHDIYTFIAFREEDPPGEDILPQIQEIAEQRRARLAGVLEEIVASSSGPEAPELFAPTLLRLSLI